MPLKRLMWITVVLFSSSAIAGVPSIYWTNQGTRKVSRADLDGSNAEDIAHNSFDAQQRIGFTVASEVGHIYWVGGRGIYRANLDGTERDIFVRCQDDLCRIFGLIVLPKTGKLVWIEEIGNNAYLRSVAIDGTNAVTIRQVGDDSDGLIADDQAKAVYWAEADKIRRYAFETGQVSTLIELNGPNVRSFTLDVAANVVCWIVELELWCASLEGGQPELLAGGLPYYTSDPALDAVSGYVYWGEPATRTIRRASLDGAGIEIAIDDTGLIWPVRVQIDLVEKKVLWSDGGGIRRANLNGSDGQTLVVIDRTADYQPEIQHFIVDSLAGKAYWYMSDSNGRCDSSRLGLASIERVSTDGTDHETVVQTQVSRPSGIAMDRASGKLYWTNAHKEFCLTGSIVRANPDGTNIDSFSPPISAPRSFALDAANGKVYWADGGVIKRADVNGFEQETVLSTVGGIVAIALDLASRKLYWTNWSTNELRRANLEGSNSELVTSIGASSVVGLAVDPIAGKVYLASDSTIFWSSIDGTDVQGVFATAPYGFVNGLAIDPVSSRLYWSYGSSSRTGIQSASLYGGAVEDVVTFVWQTMFNVNQDPYALAIDSCGRDRAVGFVDHPLYVECLGGPHEFATGECNCADITGDWRVDLWDYATFQRTFASR